VQVEGHTDDNGEDFYSATYAAMLARASGLLEHRNLELEPVLSVAGYGENRPVTANIDDLTRSTNRRIDLRFIMFSPSRSEQIDTIRQRLRGAVEATP